MRSTLPRLAGLPSPAPPAPPAAVLAGWVVGLCAAWLCGCGGAPPQVAPGEPIAPAAEVTLGTMEVECEALLAALALYKECPNLEDEDRTDIDAWRDRAQQDFAAGKKANPEPNAQHAIAAACRKAVISVTAANERCHNGPRPPD